MEFNSTLFTIYDHSAAKSDRADKRKTDHKHSRPRVKHGWKKDHVRFSPYRRALSFATRAVIKRLAINDQGGAA